jgi:hypothetical protein
MKKILIMPCFEEFPSKLENLDSGRIDKALIEEIGDQTLRPFTVGSIKYTRLFDPKSNEYTLLPC